MCHLWSNILCGHPPLGLKRPLAWDVFHSRWVCDHAHIGAVAVIQTGPSFWWPADGWIAAGWVTCGAGLITQPRQDCGEGPQGAA